MLISGHLVALLLKCSLANHLFQEVRFSNKIEILHQIESYSDKISIPSHVSGLAEDFVMCCLRRNPFNRKNVYKLLQHPFIQSAKGDANAEDDEKADNDLILKGENYDEPFEKTITGGINPPSKRPTIKLPKNASPNEVTISNYDQIVSNFEKKGHKDKLILELVRDLDDKTFAIEIRLKANRKSETCSKATPNSESDTNGNTQRFFPPEPSLPTAKAKPKSNKHSFRVNK